MASVLEEGTAAELDYAKVPRVSSPVLPVVLQEADTGEVLFVGYANDEAVRATLERGSAVLWSTSRNELWHKGATSGDFLDLVDVLVNCEQNSLLYRVRRRGGGACHTTGPDGSTRPTCYYRRLVSPSDLAHVDEL